MGGLRLAVADWVGPARWRWVLTGPGDEFLADHEVDLRGSGGAEAGWEGFTDLEWFLRWRGSVDRRAESEAALVAQVGEWITEHALGREIAQVLVARPGPVRVVVPEAAGVLAYRPWQAARVGGRCLAGSRVTLVTDPFGRALTVKRPVGERLRVLAVFSLPDGTSALNLRRERFALARLVNDIAAVNGRAIELRVLQYGVTRARLEAALLEEAGWDVLHVSGHGLPAGLVLEDEAGRKDVIGTADLVDLVEAAADQLKLITLSACESAALTADDHLRLLGLAPVEPAPGGGEGENGGAGPAPGSDATGGTGADAEGRTGSDGGGARRSEAGERSWGIGADGRPLPGVGSAPGGGGSAGAGGGPLPGEGPVAAGGPSPTGPAAGGAGLGVLASALVDRVDAAVLAMRYPVADDFAIGLAGRFYDLVLGKGQPVDRALGLALPRVVPARPSAGVPALSLVTPALFGARALDLKLTAPQGDALVFQAERVKLARFPDQPQRFVGRVGPMTRASTALAPRSGQAGVLFHGMAGAGKTACALELAYTHQDGFQALVWHQAPTRDQDIAAAFTNLAADLEAQLPGLRLVHLADDVPALRAFLPTLTQFLETNRVLIVLDNLEFLLTSGGGWRDERWGLLIDALAVPRGLSRLVLTSRTRPASLPAGFLVEAVHALSLQESVLLAREWPHLKALIDTPDEGRLDPAHGRGLAARVLAVVQGHPKLIELADGQAAAPVTLATHLDGVDRTWLTQGVRLHDFLDTGEPAASDEDYYRVLDTWTRTTSGHLPEACATLLAVLAGLEDDDRTPFVLNGIWPRVWTGLGHPEPAPDLPAVLAPLVGQALVAAETDPDTGESASYRIHPGVAESTRTHTPTDTAAVIDTNAAGFWQAALSYGLEHEAEGMGPLILWAGRSAAPYLARQRDWAHLTEALGEVLVRDTSPDTAAALLPHLHLAAQATAGTDQELDCGHIHARALRRVRSADAAAELQRLLDLAERHDNHAGAAVIAGDLFYLYRDAGRLEEALTLADRMGEHTRRAGHGPWTQLGVQNRRLQIQLAQGQPRQVLDTVQALRATMTDLPEESDQPETANPWNVRETLLDIGRTAASDLEDWQLALDLNAEQLASLRARGADEREQAFSAANDYGPLQVLGRLGEARALLLWCRQVFQAHHDIPNLGKTVSALADIEDELGHGSAAISLEHDALRLKYATGGAETVGVSHHNLANYLDRQVGGRWEEVWAHRIAAAVIAYLSGSGRLASRVQGLAQLAALSDAPPPPASFTQVCELVGRVEGVDLAALVGRLPRRVSDGQAAMDAVLALAREMPPDQALDLDRYLRVWGPVISALVAASNPDAVPDGDVRAAAGAFLDQALDHFAGTQDWAALAGALGRVRAGERDRVALGEGLDAIDTAILARALAALEGSDPIDPTLWSAAGDGSDGGDQGEEEPMAGFVAAVAAAAGGDADAAAALTPVLDTMAADPQSAGVAAAVRSVIGGERDPAALTAGLDPALHPLITGLLAALATADGGDGSAAGAAGAEAGVSAHEAGAGSAAGGDREGRDVSLPESQGQERVAGQSENPPEEGIVP
ncbi:MAG TPA: CHAT domain-containing protein [Kineosporiaceae bacterium]|nr:CHAT domain-containing protein [Kineosporiaceae bacterium]